MLGYAKFIALNKMYMKTEHGKYLFDEGKTYYGRFNHNDVLIYDNNDQAIRLGYYPSCFKMNIHYSNYFKQMVRKSAENGKEFYKIRTGE